MPTLPGRILMTPAEFKAARHKLGFSVRRCAEELSVTPRTIRRWEDGTRDIPGPAVVLIRLLAAER